MGFETIETSGEMAPYARHAALLSANEYEIFTSNEMFFAMAPPQYYQFMNRAVKNWLYWADGYVPYYHSGTSGIASTKIGKALVEGLAGKVAGSRIFFKNAGEENNPKDYSNTALQYIALDWSEQGRFFEAVKKAILYAAAAGTSLLKLNRSKRGLWLEALRFDRFSVAVNARGDIRELKCYIDSYVDTISGNDIKATYLVVEHRFFKDEKPYVEYEIHRMFGSDTMKNYSGERLTFANVPRKIRSEIATIYADIAFDKPILLPFKDTLGAELVKWSLCVPNLPGLPFGEGLLANLIQCMIQWDYYFSAFGTDMYTGRARIVVPTSVQKTNSTGINWNTGLDDYTMVKVPTLDPEKQKIESIQFNLRAADWKTIRDMLIENIAFTLGVNVSTIASFLADNNASRTAREVSTEENETALFVDKKRAILEEPINRILKLVTLYNGYTDTVAVRWSQAGLTNRHTLTEIIAMAKNGGFLSTRKAVEMFNYDDDVKQQEEETKRIEEEMSAQGDRLENYDLGGGYGEEEPNGDDIG